MTELPGNRGVVGALAAADAHIVGASKAVGLEVGQVESGGGGVEGTVEGGVIGAGKGEEEVRSTFVRLRRDKRGKGGVIPGEPGAPGGEEGDGGGVQGDEWVLTVFEALDFHSECAGAVGKDGAGDELPGVGRGFGQGRLAEEEGGFTRAQTGEGAEGEGAAGEVETGAGAGLEQPGEDAVEGFVVVGTGFVAVGFDFGEAGPSAEGVGLDVTDEDGPLAEAAEAGELEVGAAEGGRAVGGVVFDGVGVDGGDGFVFPPRQGAVEGGTEAGGGGGCAGIGFAVGQAGGYPLGGELADGDGSAGILGVEEGAKLVGPALAAVEDVFGGADGLAVGGGEAE